MIYKEKPSLEMNLILVESESKRDNVFSRATDLCLVGLIDITSVW